jgi:hypothetical protein
MLAAGTNTLQSTGLSAVTCGFSAAFAGIAGGGADGSAGGAAFGGSGAFAADGGGVGAVGVVAGEGAGAATTPFACSVARRS